MIRLRLLLKWLTSHVKITVLVCIAVVVFLVYLARVMFFGSPKVITDGKIEDMKSKIKDLSDDIAEARAKDAVEVAVIRTQDAAVRSELADVIKIPDAVTRRQRLVDLYNRTHP
jgi:hypothetical protein